MDRSSELRFVLALLLLLLPLLCALDVPKAASEAESVACVDKSDIKSCKYWKDNGGCMSAIGFMTMECGHTCKLCHMHNPHVRCAGLHHNNTSIDPGPQGLKALFERLERLGGGANNCDASSSASVGDGCISDEKETTQSVSFTTKVLSRKPWVVVLENFLSVQEADGLVALASNMGFQRSTSTGPVDATGTIDRTIGMERTSQQVWCQGACDDNAKIKVVSDRITYATGIPAANFEHMQMLKYDVGQYYKEHHDFINMQPILAACGSRIMTFFLYLSDVEEGGETAFSRLDLKVVPRKGDALLWVNVLEDNFDAQEPMTYHEAMPVIKGVKYAANAWIHPKDYRTVNLWACSG